MRRRSKISGMFAAFSSSRGSRNRQRWRADWKWGLAILGVMILCVTAIEKPYRIWKAGSFAERAGIAVERKEFGKAALHAKVALAADSTNALAAEHLAEAYESVGRCEAS